MNIGQLVNMANQIGSFFASMPDRQEAMKGIAEHIRKFWEPRMRRELLALLGDHPQGNAEGVSLDPLVLQAIEQYRAELVPRR